MIFEKTALLAEAELATRFFASAAATTGHQPSGAGPENKSQEHNGGLIQT